MFLPLFWEEKTSIWAIYQNKPTTLPPWFIGHWVSLRYEEETELGKRCWILIPFFSLSTTPQLKRLCKRLLLILLHFEYKLKWNAPSNGQHNTFKAESLWFQEAAKLIVKTQTLVLIFAAWLSGDTFSVSSGHHEPLREGSVPNYSRELSSARVFDILFSLRYPPSPVYGTSDSGPGGLD